ncbi:hypothetical protein F5148DRAFT_654946 [Russula earlei]|uniref:Uncharacterized protein n=1 Tax=Russula earlei TaxID=71964 RepID=A0ACC0UME8_9AGAM|nr:hypothetical protein F5148DRAFT_654946 [Russula earlei]
MMLNGPQRLPEQDHRHGRRSLCGRLDKIDSVQNVIALLSDLRDAWDNYEFGVDPKNNFHITAFTNGIVDVNGLRLQLDHMKGAGELAWAYEDYDDAFGDGCNLSNWGTREGKDRLELASTI